MMHCSSIKFPRISAGLLCGVLFVGLSVPARAQRESSPSTGRGFGSAYDSTHETSLVGTIEQVIVNHESGSPAGVHLLIAGPQGPEDAYIGPFLNEQVKGTLQPGVSVQLTGSPLQFHDKEYFLVRELSVGGHTTTIRSQRGFLVTRGEIRAAGASKNLAPESKGGR